MDRDTQALVGDWLLQTGDIEPGYQEAHLGDEMAEFQHEFDNGRDPEKLRGELADIAIAVLGIAAQYEFDLEEAVREKMAVVHEKYNPDHVRFFMERGHSRAEAMAICKRGWEKAQRLIEYD